MLKTLGAVLLVLGLLALVYRGFTYTKETHDAKVGPIEIELKDKKRVDLPVWVGAVGVIAGGALLVAGSRER